MRVTLAFNGLKESNPRMKGTDQFFYFIICFLFFFIQQAGW